VAKYSAVATLTTAVDVLSATVVSNVSSVPAVVASVLLLASLPLLAFLLW
jgi:hypothetical protein